MKKPKPFTRIISKDAYRHEAAYAVHGFWSGDSVRLSRSKNLSDLSAWRDPEINWSTGGADRGQEPDRIVAAECFAAAIKDAVKLAKRWNKSK